MAHPRPRPSIPARAVRRRGLAAIVAVLLALVPLGPTVTTAAAATTTVKICSQSATHTYNIMGASAAPLRAKLEAGANFGPSGRYGDYAFAYVDLGATITKASLDSNACDIYFSGYETDGSYTTTELSELQSWVAASKANQVVAGCDASSHDPVCDALGYTVTTDTDSYGFVVDVANNPINCDGSLAANDQLVMAGGVGGYFSGAAVQTSHVIAVHETGGTADKAKPIVMYTGQYFLTSDINMIMDGGTEQTVSAGGGIVTNNDKLVVNGLSSLADAASGKAVCTSAPADESSKGTCTQGTPVFFEDFDDTPGVSGEHVVVESLPRWDVTPNVDVFSRGNATSTSKTHAVDLAGTPTPSTDTSLTSKAGAVKLAAGDYTVEFNVRGNNRTGPADSVTAGIVGGASTTASFAVADGYRAVRVAFSVTGDASPKLFIKHTGATDPHGPILDTVTVCTATGGGEGGEPSTGEKPVARDIAPECDPEQADNAGRFSDVEEGSVHAYKVNCIVGKEITQGYSDGTYRPANTLPRAQTATFLVRTLKAAGLLAEGRTTTTDWWPDDAGVHEESINLLTDHGIIARPSEGDDGETLFRPGDAIERGRMAVWVDNAVTHAKRDVSPSGTTWYSDLDETPWYRDAVNGITDLGIVTGSGDGTFGPRLSLSRAQMATFLARTYSVLVRGTGG